MASYSDILFGRIALGNRLVTPAQVTQALAAAGGRATLADVLVQRGVLTREQAQRVQRAQALTQFMRAEKIYARIVLERRWVDLAVLRECFARQEQAQHRVRIGQLLIERRLLTPEQSEEVVEEQLQRLADETAKIEEAGLTAADVGDSDDLGRQVEDLAKLRAAGDLDGSTFRRALGPRGLLEASPPPATTPEVERTIEMAAPVGARTMVVDAPSYARPGPASAAPRPAPAPAQNGAKDALVGRTIASRYRVLEKVGEGGMGTVYKAEHCLMEKIVALKVLNPGLISSKPSLERFRREIRAASKFQHKHVIQIYDAGEAEGGLFYMAMEFVAGQTLEDVLKADGALPVERVARLMRQTLGAVGEAHKKGIVHRDLKSGNIMLVTGKDGEDVVKVMDFGIAKIALESSDGSSESGMGGLYKTQEGVVTGTPQYMSPEQCSGEAVDGRSDLYSLGVILFEMLTGELPFKSNTPMGFLGKHIVEAPPPPSSLRPGLPRVLEDVTLRLLEKRPDARYQSAEEVLAALDGAPAGRAPDRAPPDRAPESRLPAVGLTVEVPAPLAPESPAPQPTVALPAVVPATPTRAPAPTSAPAPAGSRAPLVVVGLGLALALVASVTTTLALLLGGGDGEHPALKEAAALLERGDAAAAAALLEPVVQERPDDRGAADLLARARGAEWSGFVQRADDLAARWRQGQAQADAAAAVGAYEAALGRKDDAAVRARLDQLRTEVATQGRPPRPTTEAPPSDPPKDPPKDPLAPGRVVLGTFEQALRAGRLEEAAGHLAEAERLLPSGHTDVEVARRTLGAARGAADARAARAAGDLPRARELLEAAIREHPDRQQQGELRRELEALVREAGDRAAAEAAAAERKALVAARDEALAAALEAALALDVDAATAALERAREPARRLSDEAPVRARAQALQALAPLAPALRSAEEQLRAVTEPPEGAAPPTPARVQAVMTRLDELRGRLTALAQDEPLASALHRRLGDGLARAEQALARAQRPPERPPTDERVGRFLRMVERVRELPDERETQALAQGRLQRVQQLVEHPVYVSGDCPAAERTWIDERLRHWTARVAVWADLGPRMITIPGGAWTSPAGAVHALPAVYYAGDAEVTCVEWDEFVRATGRARPRGFPGPTDEPVRSISLEDAVEYCRWRSRRPDGKPRRVEFRLPTEGEWERAARGASGAEYPWGATFEAWRADEGYAAVRGRLARVRSFQRDKNDWDLHDVVGNVQELTSTRRDGKLVVKGGSIASALDQTGASAVHLVAPGNEASPTIGLRLFAVER